MRRWLQGLGAVLLVLALVVVLALTVFRRQVERAAVATLDAGAIGVAAGGLGGVVAVLPGCAVGGSVAAEGYGAVGVTSGGLHRGSGAAGVDVEIKL